MRTFRSPVGLLVETVGDGGGGELVEHAENVEARDGVLGGGTSMVMMEEVGVVVGIELKESRPSWKDQAAASSDSTVNKLATCSPIPVLPSTR